MTYQPGPQQPPVMPAYPPPARRKRNLLPWIISAAVAAVGLCLFVAILATAGPQKPAATSSPATSSPAAAVTGNPALADVPEWSSANTVAPTTKAPTAPAKAKVQIEADTLVHVGEDVPAGTYRAVWDANAGEAFGLTGECYWKKSSDAEGQDIIANDIVTGGRPQVTLKKGQWFTSARCGEWLKK